MIMKYIRRTVQTTTYTYTVNENGVDYHFTDVVEGALTLYALTKKLHREHDNKETGRIVTLVNIESIEENRYEMSVKDFIENAELVDRIK
jgi:hypothetical protein